MGQSLRSVAGCLFVCGIGLEEGVSGRSLSGVVLTLADERMAPKLVSVVFIVLWFAPLFAYALTVKPKTFDQLVLESDEVIQGRVVSKESQLGEGRLSHHIFTYIEFNQLEIIKGAAQENSQQNLRQSYRLRVVGGRVGNWVQAFPGAPHFEIGQDYVLFVRGNGIELFPLVGVYQGVYQVVPDAKGQQVVRAIGQDKGVLRSVSELKGKRGRMILGDEEEGEVPSRLQAKEFKSLIRQRWQQLRSDPEGGAQ